MSKELKNITENVMSQIHQGKAKMKPKIYFIIGSFLALVGLISSVIVSIFLIGLIRFSLRTHGKMAQYKFDQMISDFPWWTILLAILSLVIGVWLIRQYDFSYKKTPWVIITIFIVAILSLGYIVDTIGLNDAMLRRGPMKGLMNNYSKVNKSKNNLEKEMLKERILQRDFKQDKFN